MARDEVTGSSPFMAKEHLVRGRGNGGNGGDEGFTTIGEGFRSLTI